MPHSPYPEVKKLVAFVESHGVAVNHSTRSQLWVQAVYSRQVSKPGELLRVITVTQEEIIPASYPHVRDWLGY